MPQLSIRLSAIAALVPFGARVCDIGTDHGYLAIELVRSGIAQSVIAADISEKPLQNARKNIELSGISSIDLRLCDGLSGIAPQETDTIVIAGMGGEVISGILERGKEVAQRKDITVILQPTTSPEALRKYLYESGFEIKSETPVLENSKLYSVMLVCFTGLPSPQSPSFYYGGKVTPQTTAGRLYLEKQLKRCFSCMQALENSELKKAEFSEYKSAYEGLKSLF